MGTPVAAFTAAARGVRVRVRVLASVADVDADYLGGRPRMGKQRYHAFFVPRSPLPAPGSIVGTITLPAEGALLELVPHECTHAVMHELRGACHTDDEELATSIGLLSAAVFKGLEKRGLAPW